jgi:hypothetical protein
MNENKEKPFIEIPDIEKVEIKPPFETGDLVMMRSKALQLVRFRKYPENDIGIVIEVKPNNMGQWLVNVHWQKFIPKSGKCIIKHTRLKKVRKKKIYE